MKSQVKNCAWLLIGVGALTLGVSVRAAGLPQIPARFTNLQVLPKDITQDQLVGLMKSVTQSLGVRCSHCHDGVGDDLSTYNFAADTKEPKATARVMLRMTSQLNNALKDVGPRKGDANKISCQTCHRGNKTPAK